MFEWVFFWSDQSTISKANDGLGKKNLWRWESFHFITRIITYSTIIHVVILPYTYITCYACFITHVSFFYIVLGKLQICIAHLSDSGLVTNQIVLAPDFIVQFYKRKKKY